MTETGQNAVRIDEQTLRAIAERLVATFTPHAIYLFGSHAHGEPTQASDVDVMVVLEGDGYSLGELCRQGYAKLRDLRLPIELHFVRRPSFERRSRAAGSFENEIATRGRRIYGG